MAESDAKVWINAEKEAMQKLKERIEDAEMLEYSLSRSLTYKRIKRVGSMMCFYGSLFGIELRPDVINLDVDTEQEAGATDQVTAYLRAKGDPPAATKMIERLRDMLITQEHIYLTPECCICADDFILDDIIHVLPGCGHFYHKDCSKKWLTEHWTCAMCREPLRFARVVNTRRAICLPSKPSSPIVTVQPVNNGFTTLLHFLDGLQVRAPPGYLDNSITTYSTLTDTKNSYEDEPMHICILAYIERVADAPKPLYFDTPVPVECRYSFSAFSELKASIYRHSRSANMEIVRLIFTLPRSALSVEIHLNVPASAASVALEVSAPAFIRETSITVSARAENITETNEILESILEYENRDFYIAANIPASPEYKTYQQMIGGEHITPPIDVNFEVSAEVCPLPTTVTFEKNWSQADTSLYY